MDRGARSFVVDKEDHIRRLEDGRHVIADSFGTRFLVHTRNRRDGGIVRAGHADARRSVGPQRQRAAVSAATSCSIPLASGFQRK
jgi:hypothetical protein